jgi:hypothetical protein
MQVGSVYKFQSRAQPQHAWPLSSSERSDKLCLCPAVQEGSIHLCTYRCPLRCTLIPARDSKVGFATTPCKKKQGLKGPPWAAN